MPTVVKIILPTLSVLFVLCMILDLPGLAFGLCFFAAVAMTATIFGQMVYHGTMPKKEG